MTTNFYQEKITAFAGVDPARVQTPLNNICKFHAEAGTISLLDIWTDFISAGTQKFTMRINGVDQFPVDADRPVLTSLAHVAKTGLSFDVDDGDLISFDLVAVSSPGLYAPIYFRVGIDVAGGGGGTGIVETIVAGTNVTVDDTDPANPIVSATGGGGGTPAFSPDNPYAVPSTEDDEFDGGSLDAKWSTFVTLPVLTFDIPGMISMKESVTTMTGIAQLPANTDTEWAMKVTNGEGTTSGSRIGFVTYSAGNRRNTFYVSDNGPPGTFYSGMWLNNTSEFSQSNMGPDYGANYRTFYMKIRYTASSNLLEFFKSIDGFTWILIGDNVTNSQSMAGAISHIGIYCQGSTTKRSFVHFFRRIQGGFLGA